MNQPMVVVTTKAHVARQCNLHWSTVPLLLPHGERMADMDKILEEVVRFARAQVGHLLFVTCSNLLWVAAATWDFLRDFVWRRGALTCALHSFGFG